MIAYLDTHIAAWLVSGQIRKLSRAATRKIEQCSLLISPAVLMELEYLFEVNRLPQPSLRVVETLQADLEVAICDLTFSRVAQSAIHEKWTRDTFDRLIVAHARANAVAALISADERIRTNYHATVW